MSDFEKHNKQQGVVAVGASSASSTAAAVVDNPPKVSRKIAAVKRLMAAMEERTIAGRALRHLISVGKVSTSDAIDAVARATTQHETSTMELEELDDIINESNSATDGDADGTSWNSGEGIKGPAMTIMNNGTLQEEDLKSKAVTSKANINKTKERTNNKNNKNSKNKYRTRHVALQFCYDGTQYSGYAQNIGKDDDTSVERTLFAALEKTNLLISPPHDEHVLGEKVQGVCNNSSSSNSSSSCSSARSAAKYSRCGRTDKGVHAHGQVIALHLRSAFHPLAQRIVRNGDDNSNNNSSNEEEMQPQTLMLDEEALPKNSFDSLTCLVPTTSKSTTKSNNKSSSTTAPPSTTTTMEQKTISELDYPKILNGVLPSSIRILGWCPVSSQFSARFSCSNRTYRYYFPHRTNLDLSYMAKGLQYMMGRHDFRNFCKMNCEQVYNFERVIISGTIISPSLSYHVDESNVRVVASTCPTNKKEEEEMEQQQQQISSSSSSTSCRDMCHIEIVGQAFLWHQIRCIMSILFYIGRKQEVPEIVNELVDVTTNPAKPAYDMASETALVLHHCEYSNINFGRSVRNLWDVTKTLERQWEEYAIATERIRDALDSLVGNTAIQVRYMDLKEFIEKIADSRANKMMKKGGYNTNGIVNVQQQQQQLLSLQAQSNDDLGTLSWGEAIIIIQNTLGIYPYPPDGISHEHKVNKGLTETTVHIPIMDRARGTTYEEKVQSIISSSRGNGATTNNKRKERFEQNIVKKRKTTQEDAAFYNHMLQQGGSSI
jgi:tRNA pseudouridine38/39 synthase